MKPLAIIIPTKNEFASIIPLIGEISASMGSRPWKLVFVDDSTDQTALAIATCASDDRRIQLVHQKRGGGLTGAIYEGLKAVPDAKFIAVMDGDRQHDPAYLPELVHQVRSGRADIAIASRVPPLPASAPLTVIESATIKMAKAALPNEISDPLSRFFVSRRSCIEAAAPKATTDRSTAPLLAILAANPTAKVEERPLPWRPREQGRSKAGLAATASLLFSIARLRRAQPAKAA